MNLGVLYLHRYIKNIFEMFTIKWTLKAMYHDESMRELGAAFKCKCHSFMRAPLAIRATPTSYQHGVNVETVFTLVHIRHTPNKTATAKPIMQ